MSRHGCLPARGARRLVVAGLGALLLSQLVWGVSGGPVVALASSSGPGPAGHANRFDPSAGSRSVSGHLPVPRAVPGPKPAYSPPHVPSAVPMRPGLGALGPVSRGP